MPNITCFKMPWKQETVNLDSVILVLKTYGITREDFEHIINDSESERISWKHKNRITSIFEVYPDGESFNKRVIPITLVKDTFFVPDSYKSTDYDEILWEKLKEKKDDIQEFWKGEVITIEIE